MTLTCPSSIGQLGLTYSSFFSAENGTLPYIFSIIGGALPDGLTLNASTGEVPGTPTVAGTFNFIGQVEDNDANTATVECSITIQAAPASPCIPRTPRSNSLTLTDGESIKGF